MALAELDSLLVDTQRLNARLLHVLSILLEDADLASIQKLKLSFVRYEPPSIAKILFKQRLIYLVHYKIQERKRKRIAICTLNSAPPFRTSASTKFPSPGAAMNSEWYQQHKRYKNLIM